MKKNIPSKSGTFTFRVLLTFTLCSTAVFFAVMSFAGTPRSAKNSVRSKQASTSPTEVAPSAPTAPGTPRYYNYAPGPGIGEAAGEPSIGFNPSSGKVMYLAGLQTLRATLPDKITPLGSVPAACNADWLDVSFTGTKVRSADPIMFTDQGTGRTFVSQLNTVTQTSPVLIGLNSLMAYTDDDGATWTPAQVNPPDGSNDHETVGAGPYPAALSNLANSVNKGHAVYYCGQGGYVLAVTSVAYCSRSDDGGLNFGKSIPAYTDAASGCSQAIHGHVKVAPDGTVYLPNAQCGGGQAVAVSTDAGTTWTVRTVPGSASPAGIIDPSVAVSKDPPVAPATSNTMYFAYAGPAAGGNHMFVAVTKDRGLTWSTPVDVGASLGINNVVFPAAVAGDSNRAAVAFLGTTQTGDHQAANFQGTWYGFVAHTYDGGQTWTTVNATPDGPVQRNSCIWNGGGNNPCRNLLDFTDATIDDKGMVLFGFADGCVGACETGGPNSYASKATIARQSGGKGVFAANDVLEPRLPQRACLTACRDDKASYLTWIAPDNGGSDLIAYNIYRSDANHTETLVGQQINPAANTFTDRNIDPTVNSYNYRITAVNGLGEGPASNSVSLPVGVCLTTGGPCVQPGVNVIVDPAGDETDAQPAHDITSVSMSEPITNTVTGAASNIVVTMKVATFKDAAGNFTIPPGWRWSIRFGVIKNGHLITPPNDSTGGPGEDFFVGMVSDGQGAPAGSGNPSFTYGVTSVPNGTARIFSTIGNIDPSSNATVDGTITLVMPKSIIQNPGPGDTIAITLASVRLGAPSGGTNETIPDITGPGTYVLRANNLCLPDNPPVAVLSANVDHGDSPLTVNFDASASNDTDGIDQIASYTFNFNDGGNDVTQSTPTISHTFNASGEYIVRLVVTDSRGKQSSNTASLIVSVDPILALTSIGSRETHGSAGPFDIDLPLTSTAGIECRTPGSNNSFNLIYTFNKAVTTAGSASLTLGSGGVGQAVLGPNPNQVTVPLTGVSNAQHFGAKLDGVQDSGGGILNNLSARMDVLLGDVNASGRVDAADVSSVRQQTLQPVTNSNFRNDVNASGRIDAADVSVTRQQTLTSLP
jgi:PKD repeat protein